MKLGILDLVLTALAGGGVGFLSGVFGVGGAFLIVPVLNIVLRIPMELAVGSGACQVLGPATTSVLARRLRIEHLRLPLTIAGGLMVGVFVGAEALEWAQRSGAVVLSEGSSPVPLAELVVLGAYFVLLVGLGLFSLYEVRQGRRNRPVGTGWISGWAIPPTASFAGVDDHKLSIAVLAGFGVAVGFLAGLLGIGGGLVLLPGLIYLLGMRTQAAVMSSLVIVWIVAAQATVVHAWRENIDLRLVAALLLGGTIGARLGSEIGLKLTGRRLRQAFGWLLLVTAGAIGAKLGWLTQ